MNIGFVHFHKFPEGGAEKVTSNIAPYLSQMGHNIFVFISDIQPDLLSVSDKEYISFIDTNNQDFLHFNDKQNTFVQNVKRLKIDILVFVAHTQFDIENLKKLLNCKIVFSHHGSPFWEIEDEKQQLNRKLKTKKNPFSLLKHKILNYFKIHCYKDNILQNFKYIYNHCDAFTILCEPYKDIFCRKLKLKNTEKIKSIPNGILPPPIPYSLEKKKQLLYVGRLSHNDKRVDRLLDIWKNIYKKFPDWELLIVGEGMERPKLEAKTKENKLERIIFCGSTNSPWEYYNTASILCLSSQFEGWGLVLTEAQQAGAIPIAFNCSKGVEHILSPSWTNGVLIDGFNLKTYESALCKLMNDDVLRSKMQQNIIDKAKDYDINLIAQQWDSLFREIHEPA